jgi:glyoxylase-like metal-dependent hydrolase (beta-lactamase superfamily II)
VGRRVRGFAIGVLMCLPARGFPQSSVTLASALEGRRVIEQMVAAVGGRDALRSISTIVTDESIRRTATGQGLNTRAPGVTQGRRTVWYDVAGQRINELRILDITGNQLWDVQRFIGRNAGTVVSWSSMTKDSMPVASLPSQRAAFARRNLLPFLMSLERRPPDAVRSLGTTMIGGKAQDVVGITDVDGAQLTLVVDRQTHLPTRIEQLAISAAMGDTVDVLTFSDYRKVGRLFLPHRRDESRSNETEWEYRVERFEIDTPIADTTFAVPDGLTQAAAPATNVQKLAPDVYLVPGGYQSVFVVFDEYVVVLEAGAGQGRNIIARIREVASGKPIRYVVATHFHDDHVAGLRPFIAEGTTIVTTADAKGRIEALARTRSRLAPDTLDRSPRAPVIEVVEKQRTFKDARHEVQLHQVGPNAHVDQILIGYLPAERILFEGDLLDMASGEPAAGGDDTADFARKLRALGLAFDRLIPVHGEMGTAADLEKSLRRGLARAKCPLGAERRTPCWVDERK